MENATKALLIAGGVLLGILILGVLIYMATTLSSLSKAKEKEKEIEQIAEFNKVYESYDKKKLRGTEVVSIINRAIDNNTKYEGNSDRQIKVYVTVGTGRNVDASNQIITGDNLTSGTTYEFTGIEQRDDGSNDGTTYNSILSDTTTNGPKHSFMYSRYFKCTKITYNSSNGMVNAIYFEQR